MATKKVEVVKYTAGYKYQLAEAYTIKTPFTPAESYTSLFISLFTDGTLVFNRGYAWDGPSGITIDTDTSIRGSLIHDGLYQLMRHKVIPLSVRLAVDHFAYEKWVEDGMWKWRARLWRRALKRLGKSAALPKNIKKVLTAPKVKKEVNHVEW